MRTPYAELAVTSNFTFLTGASHPEELVEQAAALGHAGIAITDWNTLGGIVRAHVAARRAGLPLVVGSRVRMRSVPGEQEPDVLLFATDRAGYGRLCRLLSSGKRRAAKGACDLFFHDVIEQSEGLLGVVLPTQAMDDRLVMRVRVLRDVLGPDRLWIAAGRRYAQDDAQRVRMTAHLCEHLGVPMVAINDVHYHVPGRRRLQDVLTCIRHGCTIQRAGLRLSSNAERHLKPGEEMARLLAGYPEALRQTLEIVERARGFSLDELRYEYPSEVVPRGTTATAHLRELTWRGAARRYPGGIPDGVRTQIAREIALIEELGYEHYFLTVHDLVEFAVSQGILCQGRGAAANSAVCYCLGVTAVDPTCVNLLFERFISRERDEPPDIDIDFEHERREEVIQYIYRKYGRDRAALTAEVICYRGRSAVREVGKAMGLSLDFADRMARALDWRDEAPGDPGRLREIGLSAEEPRTGQVIELSRELMGFPRHRSQHVGGFVITRSALCELVPIENAAMEHRTVIEWDKDDIDAMGMLKVDCLGLGMLTCVGKALDILGRLEGVQAPASEPVGDGAGAEPLDQAGCAKRSRADAQPARTAAACVGSLRHRLFGGIARDPSDAAVYEMICRADTVGVFQIESRAQMSMLPRLRPRCYYDLVIEVAIVRPGPIQGRMVHPYLRRRNGEEPVAFASPEIERVLGRTLGVPLFQEQAMALAVVAAGFTPGEADQLRRAMAAWKRSGRAILKFETKLIEGMIARGYSRAFAEQVFEQITGFSGYGFPESHAASFAIIVYVSAWLKRHHPAVFAAALINSQPMGFYQPAQIVRDAREHGVEVRGVDVNHSAWDCLLEAMPTQGGPPPADGTCLHRGDVGQHPKRWGVGGPALRLGMRLVKGLGRDEAERIVRGVQEHGPFRSLEELRLRTGVRASTLVRLADADAFGSMGLSRQEALWEAHALRDEPAPLFACAGRTRPEADPALPNIPPEVEVAEDYESMGLSLKAHPVSFLRQGLEAAGVIANADLADERACPAGRVVTVAGVVLVRQRPGTASGVVFVTIEDETGIANLIVRPEVYERYRRVVRESRILACRGRIERQGAVVHVVAEVLRSLDGRARRTNQKSRDFH
ncbi:MAG: error-prone DNA polymerase [Phycisphaerales bacterium]